MDEIEQNVINKLREMNIDYTSLKTTIQNYLKKIEEIISTEHKIQEESINLLRKNKVNVSSIADELGLSRTTFYNNTILKAYIEFSETLFDENNPITAFNNLKASKNALQAQLNLMIERDVKSEITLAENKQLQQTIRDKNKEIKRLQARNAELSLELQKIRTSTQKNN